MSLEEAFKKNIENLTAEEVDNGSVTFSGLQGKHTITVNINVTADYGR